MLVNYCIQPKPFLNDKPILASRPLSQGFTLIELLLVITIIAVIVFYASINLRSKSQDQNIVNTKVEMENWLQAINNYSINNEGKWPQSVDQLIDNNYVDAKTVCSIWPGTGKAPCVNKSLYTLSCINDACPADEDFYRGIEITLPNQKVAQQLADILPSAVISSSSSTYKVAAYIPKPALIAEQEIHKRYKWGWIVNAGTVLTASPNCSGSRLNDAKITLPKCGSGYEGHYLVFYMKQRTGRIRQPDIISRCTTGWLFGFLDKCCRKSSKDHAYVNLTVNKVTSLTDAEPSVTTRFYEENNNQAEYNFEYSYYVTFCIPTGTWFPLVTLLEIDTRDPRQCANNWPYYNPGTQCNNAANAHKLNYR